MAEPVLSPYAGPVSFTPGLFHGWHVTILPAMLAALRGDCDLSTLTTLAGSGTPSPSSGSEPLAGLTPGRKLDISVP